MADTVEPISKGIKRDAEDNLVELGSKKRFRELLESHVSFYTFLDLGITATQG